MADKGGTQMHPDLRKQLVEDMEVDEGSVDKLETLLQEDRATGDQIADVICAGGFHGDLDDVFEAIIEYGYYFKGY